MLRNWEMSELRLLVQPLINPLVTRPYGTDFDYRITHYRTPASLTHSTGYVLPTEYSSSSVPLASCFNKHCQLYLPVHHSYSAPNAGFLFSSWAFLACHSLQ